MASADVEELYLPVALVTESAGLALDLGGSALKLLYRSKEQFENGKPLIPLDDDKAPLRLGIFAREKLDDMIQFILEKVDLSDHEDRTVYSAGMGGNAFKSKLEKALNIRLHNSPEFPSLNIGIEWVLKNISPKDLYYQVSEKAKDLTRKRHREYMAFMGGGDVPEPLKAKLEAMMSRTTECYPPEPYMVVLCGSGFLLGTFADGKLVIEDASIVGGRFYHGSLKLMTGISDHEQLVEMMENSDGRTVDMYTSEMTSADSDDSYKIFNENDMNMFLMGKAVYRPRDQIKDGDIVHSFTSVVCQNLIQLVHIYAQKAGIKNAFIMGNFVRPDFIKNRIWSSLFVRRAMATREEEQVNIEFVRYGGHLTVLGAYLGKKDIIDPGMAAKAAGESGSDQ